MITLKMEGGKLQNRKLGSVKLAIASYGQQNLEATPAAVKKFQANYNSKQLDNETRELHQAKTMVKDLTQRIEESNSRTRTQIQNSEKIKAAKLREDEEWNEFKEVMKEVEAVKRDLSKLRLEMDSVLEEERRAEKETSSSKSKARSCSSSVEALTKEIEETNEEHVLVELARMEAMKESRQIEAERRNQGERYSIEMEKMREVNQGLVREIENTKEMETRLAITVSDINVLRSKLEQVESRFNEHGAIVSASLLESVTREMEATKKELASIEAERFEFKSSMEVIQNELRRVVEEAAIMKKKEEKAESTIQSLNSKLLRAKEKMEPSSVAADKAKSTALNLLLTLEQIEEEAETAETEQSTIRVETALIKKEIRKTESEVGLAEEKMKSALQDLKAVKSSEAAALEKLKSVIEKTVRNRASSSQHSTTITISKFEYDYLKGNAAEAIEIADKKVEAAEAWIEALMASGKEIQIRSDLSRRESREVRVEKENDVPKIDQGSTAGRRSKGRKLTSSIGRGGSRSASFTIRRRK
ncbi:hypothetical protein ACS0TY_008625 [Phlomoides rotata]